MEKDFYDAPGHHYLRGTPLTSREVPPAPLTHAPTEGLVLMKMLSLYPHPRTPKCLHVEHLHSSTSTENPKVSPSEPKLDLTPD